MRAQRPLLCLASAALAAALPGIAAAQSATAPLYVGALKDHWWGRSALGLSVNRTDFAVPCQSLLAACSEVSVVGKASVGESPFSVYGKVGSTSHARAYALGTDSGFALSYGAGLSWDFSARGTATVAWDTYDLRLGSGPVRATSLGLQWRY